MSKINPRVDLAFKKIFGVEENKDLLISLINSVVSKEDQVIDVILLNPYNPKNFANDKLSILDIKAKGSNNRMFNIEIQISDEADYDKRALYYWAKIYTEQLKMGDGYDKLTKAIGIHILNFTSILNQKKYHNVFEIREKESGEPYFTDLELHTVELQKFTGKDSPENLSELIPKIKNSLDMWAAFLTRNNLLKGDNLPGILNDRCLKKAIHVLDVIKFNEIERDIYEGHLKWLMIEENTLKKAEGDGFAKGLERGLSQGLSQGLAEGEAKALMQVAKAMLLAGDSVEKVSNITGLSEFELEKLK